MADMSPLLLVLVLGAVNWVATEIVVTSVVFKDVREAVDRYGQRIKPRFPRLGEKVCYFLTCALCVGVWIGFAEALIFGGPLQPQGWVSWTAFIANGLLYKAPGHLLLQVNAWFHHRVELLKQQATKARLEIQEQKAIVQAASLNHPHSEPALSQVG